MIYEQEQRMMCLSQQQGKLENLLWGEGGQKKRKGKKPKKKYQFQNEVAPFLGRRNYLATEEIKRGNPLYKKSMF